MSEPEKFLQNFLQRWSRRKLAGAERDSEEPKAQPESGDGAVPNADDGTPPHEADADAASAFDPKSLPPIESIDAASDIRAFLAPGVPAEVARAALRRAWVSDPAIRDFVGLAENQWDFAKPDAVPGFGSLDPTPALRRMVTALFSGAPEDGVQSDSAGDAENIVGKTAGADSAATSAPAASATSAVEGRPRNAGQVSDKHAALQQGFPGNEPQRG